MIQVYLVRWERLSSMNQKKLREHTSILKVATATFASSCPNRTL